MSGTKPSWEYFGNEMRPLIRQLICADLKINCLFINFLAVDGELVVGEQGAVVAITSVTMRYHGIDFL